MLIGSNLNEFNYFNRSLITPNTMEEVKATLAERYGDENVEKFISLYKAAYPNETNHIACWFSIPILEIGL